MDDPLLSVSEDFLLRNIIGSLYVNESSPASPQVLEFLEAREKTSHLGAKKNEKQSLEEFSQGIQALNRNDNKEALSLFNKALVSAPGSSKHIASFYRERSIALQKLKAYSESLQDIERALKLTESQEEKNYLEKRKTIIHALNLNDTLNRLSVTPKDVDEQQEEIIYGESKELVGVSSALALEYNAKFGRHYVATQNINVGDVLMIQKPFVRVLLPESCKVLNGGIENSICDNCLLSILNPIPCEYCRAVIYCSEECKLIGFKKMHKIECQVTRRYPTNSRSLALRSLIEATNRGKYLEEIYSKMEKIEKCKGDRTSGFNDGKLDGTKPEALLSLLTHTDKRKDIMHWVNAAVVADTLRKDTDFLKGRATYENTIKIGYLFLKLSYVCQMNLYGIQGSNTDRRIALAMYPVFNYLNNSCANNALWYDKKDKKILRACKNIQKGEQVCVAYMTHAVVEKTAAERKKFFNEMKFFNCECEACIRNYNFKCELKRRLKIPQKLKKKLINKPNDTKSLWELLKLVVNEYPGPCLEGKRIEFALVNAHLGSSNEEVPNILRLLKLL
ncbi:SET and MYND domain-containing protein 4-like isoform X2 [Leptopilina heterotoma]|uniref:SET and MYND domain-containing protein 4-like isoform X2 n=1 Tax=Leptopilina heterotoma TaxID=63436 RepID=UPI001CAA33FD|nr:SET and MYND domain-containing protein 4-like isoform X2 [Leptopilina heterotoma]